MATYKAVYECGSGVFLFNKVSSFILDQHEQTASHAARIENCHRMHTRQKHTTSALPNTHTSHTRAHTVPRLTIQTENTTSITSFTQTYNTPRIKTISLTTAATQQTFPQPPHCHYNSHKNKHVPCACMYCL